MLAKLLRQNAPMRRASPFKPASRATCRLLLWLVAALLFSQSFASVHRIVHAPGSHVALAQLTVAKTGDAAVPAPATSTLSRWFGLHSASDCALIDHALQPTPPTAPALLPAPSVVAALPPPAMAGIVPTGSLSAFEARAPPSLLC